MGGEIIAFGATADELSGAAFETSVVVEVVTRNLYQLAPEARRVGSTAFSGSGPIERDPYHGRPIESVRLSEITLAPATSNRQGNAWTATYRVGIRKED